jgi:hypothetical protein
VGVASAFRVFVSLKFVKNVILSIFCVAFSSLNKMLHSTHCICISFLKMII